jgi:hypothetical protein
LLLGCGVSGVAEHFLYNLFPELVQQKQGDPVLVVVVESHPENSIFIFVEIVLHM